jgi:hypothetical protein
MVFQNENALVEIPDEIILSKILVIRGQKVMIDSNIAELYGVSTKRLNEQVKRNILRFPEDFMFQLTEQEKAEVVANCDHLRKLKFSPYLSNAFTEHGAVMLASVLNSERAIIVNVQIVRIYITLREMVLSNKDVLLEFDKIKSQLSDHEDRILSVFEYLKQFEKAKQQSMKQNSRPRIGFNSK